MDYVNAIVFEKIKNFASTPPNVTITFAQEELAALESLREVSRLSEYSEAYDLYFSDYLQGDAAHLLNAASTVRSICSNPDKIRVGLRKLGQPTLLTSFDLVFPPARQPTEEERKKAREDFEEGLQSQFESMLSAIREKSAD